MREPAGETGGSLQVNASIMANWSSLYNSSDQMLPENSDGQLMVGLWEAKYVQLRVILYKLNVYFLPAIICIGILGNLLCLTVFLGTYMKRLSLSIYLGCLAISDTFFLFSLLFVWLDYISVPWFHYEGVCQCLIYISYCASFMSVWLVVAFSVERYIAVCHPLRRPEMCTASRAKLVVTVLTLIACLGYSCTLWTTSVTVFKGKYRVCAPKKGYEQLHTILTYVDTTMTLLIPYVLLIIINSIIARRIATFYRHQRASGSVLYENERRCRYHGRNCNLGMRAQIKITKMLFFISAVFLLLNLPSYSVRLKVILMSFFNKDYEGTPQEFLLQQLFQFLYYINFTINFLLYSGCSDKFRDAFRRFWWQVHYRISRCLQVNLYGKFSGSTQSDQPVCQPDDQPDDQPADQPEENRTQPAGRTATPQQSSARHSLLQLQKTKITIKCKLNKYKGSS